MIKRIPVSLACGGLITLIVVLGSHVSTEEPTILGSTILLPFYFAGVIASGNPHSPNELVVWGTLLLTASTFAFVMISVVKLGAKKSKHHDS